MNTNIKTTLLNLLAPNTGGNPAGSGQNATSFGPKNGEFASIVQRIRAKHDKTDGANTPENGSENDVDEVFGHEISAKLSQVIQNKKPGEENADPSEIALALSDIAAFIEAHPEQFKDLEIPELSNNGLSPENPEKLQEINDFLATVQKISTGETQEETVVITPESSVETGPDVPATSASTKTTLQAGPDISTATALPSETERPTETISAEKTVGSQSSIETGEIGQPAASASANVTEISKTVLPQETVVAEPAGTPLSTLNPPTLEGTRSTSPQSSASGQETTSLSAEQLAATAQSSNSESETNQTPLQQGIPTSEQILAKGAENRTSGNNFKAEMESLEQMSGDNNSSSSTATESIANTPATASSVAVSDNADIARQIQESISSSYRADAKEVVIRLDPPELGKVTLRFIEKSDGITGILQVDEAQTRQEIQRALPEIVQNLQNSSVQIKKVEVVLTGQQGYDTSRDESAFSDQESGFEQQNNPHSSGNNSGYHEPDTNFDTSSEPVQSDMHVTEKSINMLI